MKAQIRRTKEGELLLVYINSNDRKKWYECYNIYTCDHLEANKDFLLSQTKAEKSSKYIELIHSLKSNYFADLEITSRLPKL